MERLTGPDLTLLAGASGLGVLVAFTIWAGPHSVSWAESQVQIAADAALEKAGASYLAATAHGQRVSLEGIVPSESIRDEAVRAVMGSLGGGGLLAGGVTKVTTRELDVAPPVSLYSWRAQKAGGQVTLSGVAPSRASLAAIEGAAELLFGGQVEGNMQLAFGAPDGVNWEIGAIQGLEAIRLLDEGEAELVGARLTVSGIADDAVAARVSENLTHPGGGISAEIRIGGPVEWSARISDGNLILSGRAGSEDASGALLAAARAAIDGKVSGTMQVGPVGGWQARALLALPHLAAFDPGELRVQDQSFTISGKAPGSALTYLREDMERLPDDGYEVIWDVAESSVALPELADINLSGSAGEQARAVCEAAFQRVMSVNSILFETGEARISRESGQTLDKVVAISRQCSGFRIEVQGHTDDRGGRNTNRRLSRVRADTVRSWLIDRGLNGESIEAEGYGQSRPAASNRTESGRAQNRRIEFKVFGLEDR